MQIESWSSSEFSLRHLFIVIFESLGDTSFLVMLSASSTHFCSSVLCALVHFHYAVAEEMINPYTWQGRVREEYNKTWTGYVEANIEQTLKQTESDIIRQKLYINCPHK